MRVFLVAGEPSGDKLGAALMAGLKALVPDVAFAGVGGPLMEAEGMESQFPMSELSLAGPSEILPKYFDLKKRLEQTADEVVRMRPDALVTIDVPEFSLRLAHRVRKAAPEQHTVHYVAPTVWAWRPKRAQRMAPDIDQVLALLPFEPPYMEAAGMRCDFVGHPVVAEPQASREEASAFRAAHGIAPEAPLILALPGSRRGEITRLAPVFGQTLRRVLSVHPEARIVVPTVGARAELMAEQLAEWPGDPILLDPRGRVEAEARAEKRAAFRAADAALAASGTVSLELAAADTPMVIGYDGSWLTRAYVSRLLLVDTVTLVNLVSETRAVPEFIGKQCRAEAMAPALLEVLADGGAQHKAMDLTMESLGRSDEAPGLRAARAVLNGLPATRG
ncbi:lipid-A-disaccharide synthase [Tropicimonas isoalkanivorans]|uniref:Lipid-A-disaccharide synthase n=1 Tax=Tropicimonas isoalkanivorans TaxID=441112 RepID=A0A1I1KG43_9RHOB|nr:lipid-A-disaccharide synthase [Tropicimonas isoalkanivorans]SFC56430.1 lipid-A-disaccharide synthase [Tropicimonas isoalkanivorans]